jgi:phosphatidate phosphatase LPIN
MKIGEAGEAFFLFETDEEVGEELATSPLQSPLTSPRLGPSEPEDVLNEKQDGDGRGVDDLVCYFLCITETRVLKYVIEQ